MNLSLTGKRAWVMGGGSGLGFAIAEALCAEGATVVLSSRSADRLETASQSLRSRLPNAKVEIQTVDLSNPSHISQAAAVVLKKPVDILINNTGGPATGRALEIPLENWDKGYQTLLRSVIQLCQLCIPAMAERRWGRILTVTSTSARQVIPNLPVSSTFRAALTAWTKELAREVGRSGILVNNLLPGPTRTDRLSELASHSPQFFQSMERESGLGRIAQPDEIGRTAAFLCSSANTYLTGTDVLVDGAQTTAL